MKKFYLLLGLVLLTHLLKAQCSIDYRLIAHYPFNGGTEDVSESGFHGYVNPTNGTAPTLTTDRFNNPNSACYFDGIDDVIEIPDAMALRLGADFTISAWIQQVRVSNSYASTILSKRQGDSDLGWMFGTRGYVTPQYGNLFFKVSAPLDTVIISPNQLNIATTSWDHVVITYHIHNQRARLYVNGVLKAIAILYVPNNRARIPMFIGGDAITRTKYFMGKIDDIRIYSRPLTQAEIQTLFNMNTGGRVESFQQQLAEEKTVPTFDIYPNPVQNTFTAKIKNTYTGKVTMCIYDMMGRKLKNLDIDKQTEILETQVELADLRQGIYLIEINTGNQRNTRKIFKL